MDSSGHARFRRLHPAGERAGSGYGYEYHKTVRLLGNGPEMEIAHTIRNTGKKPISSRVYNHNFLVIDGQAPGPDLPSPCRLRFEPASAGCGPRRNSREADRLPEDARRTRPGDDGHGRIRVGRSDYDVQIANTKTGASVRVTADRPLASLMLWSIRAVMSVEPFVEFSIKPGESYSWTLQYHYGGQSR